jgi:hypothetical protein
MAGQMVQQPTGAPTGLFIRLHIHGFSLGMWPCTLWGTRGAESDSKLAGMVRRISTSLTAMLTSLTFSETSAEFAP